MHTVKREIVQQKPNLWVTPDLLGEGVLKLAFTSVHPHPPDYDPMAAKAALVLQAGS